MITVALVVPTVPPCRRLLRRSRCSSALPDPLPINISGIHSTVSRALPQHLCLSPTMTDRPKFFDDLAGVAGGAISALAGLREEGEAILRARLDEMIRRLELVRRDEIEALRELAANARTAQEEADSRLADALARIAALESRVAALETAQREDDKSAT
jgi:BMFP domain-containing protein YqiC